MPAQSISKSIAAGQSLQHLWLRSSAFPLTLPAPLVGPQLELDPRSNSHHTIHWAWLLNPIPSHPITSSQQAVRSLRTNSALPGLPRSSTSSARPQQRETARRLIHHRQRGTGKPDALSPRPQPTTIQGARVPCSFLLARTQAGRGRLPRNLSLPCSSLPSLWVTLPSAASLFFSDILHSPAKDLAQPAYTTRARYASCASQIAQRPSFTHQPSVFSSQLSPVLHRTSSGR